MEQKRAETNLDAQLLGDFTVLFKIHFANDDVGVFLAELGELGVHCLTACTPWGKERNEHQAICVLL